MFAWLLGKPTLILALVVAGLIALAVCSRNWNCHTDRKREPWLKRERTVEGNCLSVFTANRILVEADRRHLLGDTGEEIPEPFPPEAARPREYRLAGIVVEPLETAIGDAAQAIVARMLVGKRVRIEVDNRRETEGIVYADTGAVVQVSLLREGLARLGDSFPPEWVAYEKTARKAGLGVWKK